MEEELFDDFTSELARKIDHLGMHAQFPAKTIIYSIAKGDLSEVKSLFLSYMKELIQSEIGNEKELLMQLLIIGFIGCMVSMLARIFEKGQFSKTIELIIYCITANIAVQIVMSGQNACMSFGESIRQFMQMLLPSYCVCVNLSSAGICGLPTFLLYQGLLYGMEILIVKVFMPLTRCYFVLSVLGGMGSVDRFLKMKKLLEEFIVKTSKISVYLGIGGFTIQEFCRANTTRGGTGFLLKGISMLPGIGQMSEQVTELFLTSGSFLKNVIGIVGTVFVFAIVLAPGVKLLMLGILLKLIASILAVAGTSKIATLIDEMGQGVLFYMRYLLCEVVVLTMSFLVVTVSLGV